MTSKLSIKTENEFNELVLQRVEEGFSAFNRRFDLLDASVCKHAEKLGQQDVINAQITLTQQHITENLGNINTTIKLHSEFISGFKGSLNTFKWLVGVLGFGNVAIFIKIILELV